MKIKKIAVLGALAAVAGASIATGLTSCGEKADPTGLDIHLNYSGKQGISLRDANFQNKVENANYVKGDLLPTWKAYAEAMGGITFRDASNYGTSSDNDTYKTIQASKYVSETSAVQLIDLFYNSTSNIEKMGAAGEAIDLKPYIDGGKMPNFKKFLTDNPTIEKTITKSGKIYYTPYFDGYNAIERMFVMDTAMVQKVLDIADADDTLDTVTKQGGAGNTTGKGITTPAVGFFQPFIDDNYNYPNAETKIKISKNGALAEVTVARTDNIIALQNDKLEAGTTGNELRQQFRAYLRAAYGANVGTGKTYSKLSEIFTSESACYNTDDLIALMRVIKASNKLITGDDSKEIEILVPRGMASNRVQNMLHFMKVFGIQGMDGEKEMLYYDGNGKMHDAASTQQTYEALGLLSQLYNEGLILGDFNKKTGDKEDGTSYLNQYFGHTKKGSGYGFMLYDYSASTCAMNDIVDGVGTKKDKRDDEFKEVKHEGMMPVLSPVTWWATEASTTYNASTANIDEGRGEVKTLTRYEESNRALKSNSWCIPTTADNKDKAVALMDYMYSADGKRLNDFGPSQYWKDGKADSFSYAGEKTPQFNDTFKTMISEASTDFWSFLRGYLGSTHGIGYQRSATINYLATNKYAQAGTANVENSIADGASVLCMVDKKDNKKFDLCVPTAGYGSISADNQEKYAAVTAFWAADKCNAADLGWAMYVKKAAATALDKQETDVAGATYGKAGTANTNYKLTDVITQRAERVKVYLFTMANSYKAVPAYAQATAA